MVVSKTRKNEKIQVYKVYNVYFKVYQREEVLPLHIAELRSRIFQVFETETQFIEVNSQFQLHLPI